MLGMTNYTWFIVIGYAMWPMLILAAGGVAARCTRESAFEDGRADAYAEISAERRAAELAERRADRFAARRAGRHERGAAPRREPAREDDQFRPPWYREIPGAVKLPSGGAIGVGLALLDASRSTAATLAKIPGPDRIQPGRDSGDGTVTMDRIQPDPSVTDTGAFRAASEQDIAQRSADNAAWLEEWSAGAAS